MSRIWYKRLEGNTAPEAGESRKRGGKMEGAGARPAECPSSGSKGALPVARTVPTARAEERKPSRSQCEHTLKSQAFGSVAVATRSLCPESWCPALLLQFAD